MQSFVIEQAINTKEILMTDKILIWSSKYGSTFVFARNPEEENQAWLYLFRQMDAKGYYFDIEDAEINSYVDARSGDAKAAKRLLQMRNGRYERITTVAPVQP